MYVLVVWFLFVYTSTANICSAPHGADPELITKVTDCALAIDKFDTLLPRINNCTAQECTCRGGILRQEECIADPIPCNKMNCQNLLMLCVVELFAELSTKTETACVDLQTTLKSINTEVCYASACNATSLQSCEDTSFQTCNLWEKVGSGFTAAINKETSLASVQIPIGMNPAELEGFFQLRQFVEKSLREPSTAFLVLYFGGTTFSVAFTDSNNPYYSQPDEVKYLLENPAPTAAPVTTSPPTDPVTTSPPTDPVTTSPPTEPASPPPTAPPPTAEPPPTSSAAPTPPVTPSPTPSLPTTQIITPAPPVTSAAPTPLATPSPPTLEPTALPTTESPATTSAPTNPSSSLPTPTPTFNEQTYLKLESATKFSDWTSTTTSDFKKALVPLAPGSSDLQIMVVSSATGSTITVYGTNADSIYVLSDNILSSKSSSLSSYNLKRVSVFVSDGKRSAASDSNASPTENGSLVATGAALLSIAGVVLIGSIAMFIVVRRRMERMKLTSESRRYYFEELLPR